MRKHSIYFLFFILISCNSNNNSFYEQYWHTNKEKLLTLPANIYFSIIPIDSATKYKIAIQEYNKDVKFSFEYSLRTGDTLKYKTVLFSDEQTSYFLENRLTFNKYIQSIVKYYEQFSFYYIQRSEQYIRLGYVIDGDIIVCTDPDIDLNKFFKEYKHHPSSIEKGVYFYQRPFDFLETIE